MTNKTLTLLFFGALTIFNSYGQATPLEFQSITYYADLNNIKQTQISLQVSLVNTQYDTTIQFQVNSQNPQTYNQNGGILLTLDQLGSNNIVITASDSRGIISTNITAVLTVSAPGIPNFTSTALDSNGTVEAPYAPTQLTTDASEWEQPILHLRNVDKELK